MSMSVRWPKNDHSVNSDVLDVLWTDEAKGRGKAARQMPAGQECQAGGPAGDWSPRTPLARVCC